jgi:hypothetical protein
MDGFYSAGQVSLSFLSVSKTLISNSDLSSDGIYTGFIDNQRTVGHQLVIFGIRELNLTEIKYYCSNSSITNSPPIFNEPFSFSSDYRLRTYTSGCYYLDANNNWQSDGLKVSYLKNICFLKKRLFPISRSDL